MLNWFENLKDFDTELHENSVWIGYRYAGLRRGEKGEDGAQSLAQKELQNQIL